MGESEPRLEVPQQVDDLSLDGDVEGAGGLIGHDEPHADREDPRNPYPALLSARELVREAGELARLQIHLLQQLGGPSRHLGVVEPLVQRDGLSKDIPDAHPWIEGGVEVLEDHLHLLDRKSTRLNSSHLVISYAVFCLKKKKKTIVQRV